MRRKQERHQQRRHEESTNREVIFNSFQQIGRDSSTRDWGISNAIQECFPCSSSFFFFFFLPNIHLNYFFIQFDIIVGAFPRIKLDPSRTRSKNHTTRPNALVVDFLTIYVILIRLTENFGTLLIPILYSASSRSLKLL